MFFYLLVFMAFQGSRRIPRSRRLKFQIVNAVFTVVLLLPQIYVLSRPQSWRFCQQPLLGNLAAAVALSFIASGFSVLFTMMDPIPQGLWTSYHLFGLVSFGHGLCTAAMTLSAVACAETTPELFYTSALLTATSILSTGFLAVLGGLWCSSRLQRQTGDRPSHQETQSPSH